jgi:hypothetical protein
MYTYIYNLSIFTFRLKMQPLDSLASTSVQLNLKLNYINKFNDGARFIYNMRKNVVIYIYTPTMIYSWCVSDTNF